MLNLYLYLMIELLISVFIYLGINFSIRYAPSKIRLLSIFVFILLAAREVSLLILFFCENIAYLYLLKPFVFLYIFAIPLAVVICLYIFMRNDRINFSYSFIVGIVILVFYIILMIKIPYGVQIGQQFGYYISLLNPLPGEYFYIAVNTAALIICILQIGKPGVNNVGLYMIVLAALITIVETFLSLIGIEFLAHNVVGDACWVFVLNYALMRLKK
jgi:hypothetical protein